MPRPLDSQPVIPPLIAASRQASAGLSEVDRRRRFIRSVALQHIMLDRESRRGGVDPFTFPFPLGGEETPPLQQASQATSARPIEDPFEREELF